MCSPAPPAIAAALEPSIATIPASAKHRIDWLFAAIGHDGNDNADIVAQSPGYPVIHSPFGALDIRRYFSAAHRAFVYRVLAASEVGHRQRDRFRHPQHGELALGARNAIAVDGKL